MNDVYSLRKDIWITIPFGTMGTLHGLLLKRGTELEPVLDYAGYPIQYRVPLGVDGEYKYFYFLGSEVHTNVKYFEHTEEESIPPEVERALERTAET